VQKEVAMSHDQWKFVLAFAVVLATASSSAAVTRGRTMPTVGPEWYLDDNGQWHSIRSDWKGIERPLRARRLSSSDRQNNDYQQNNGEQ
jgi:hypothetical protein